jgi:hypothetical protein
VTLEVTVEVRLVAIADLHRGLGRRFAAEQQLAGPVDARADDLRVRRAAELPFEAANEV